MSILQNKFRLMLLLLVGLLTLATPSLAIPVSGTFAIGGSSATVGADFLNFVCSALTASCPAGTGNFLVTPPATGSFVPYLGDTGFIRNMTQGTAPVNQPFSLPNWVVFNPAGTVIPPDIALDLTFIFTGVGNPANCPQPGPGQTCTPIIPALITAANPMGLSPFTLANTQTGSLATFSVAGIARRISTGEISTFEGIFTAQFNESVAQVLQQIAATGSITNSYSATFEATVPEASTITMLIGGLLVLGGVVRRRI
jgi:hypothetical protein